MADEVADSLARLHLLAAGRRIEETRREASPLGGQVDVDGHGSLLAMIEVPAGDVLMATRCLSESPEVREGSDRRTRSVTAGGVRRVSCVVTPAADIEVEADLVQALLAEQHPDLADLPLVRLDSGWDNTHWRVGDELLARFPRRRAAAHLILHEQRWLPVVGPWLPCAIPVPSRVGRPAPHYPWSWSLVPWIDGTSGDRVTTIGADAVAEQLGRFLRALHRPAPSDAPRNPYRGVGLAERRDLFEERLRQLDSEIDTASVRTTWETACSAPQWAHAPTWLHGDLHPANVLFSGGAIAAVIDFGDICAGDPATDLAAAWMLLPRSSMAAFARSYGEIDAHLEARAVGWAVLFGLMLLAIGLDDKATYEPLGRRTLDRALSAERILGSASDQAHTEPDRS
jgi:aminoglycoside phosphotransferase (APT) family kinase protein